ncbi:hypothetical protein [Micromonospora ureilytica]|uniref:hypothetical protein n=1 Tax=Micromonospora ureilytica TaxID=709868 RepID=UPI002E155356|nr:hypothetical protein OHB55_08285 [Micromonospora ureilytica]
MSHRPTRPPAGTTTPASTSRESTPRTRPGVPEIVAGLLVWTIAVFVLTPQLRRLDLEPSVHGLILTSLSGVIGLLGFAAAAGLGRRPVETFGLRPVTRRWLLAAAGLGLATLIVKSLASGVWILLSGDDSNRRASTPRVRAAGSFLSCWPRCSSGS